MEFAAETRDTVGKNRKAEIAMKCVARRSLHAHVRYDASKKDRFRAKSAKQGVKRRVMEAAVPRLFDDVVGRRHFRKQLRPPGAASKPLLAQKGSRLLDNEPGIDRISTGIRIPSHPKIYDWDTPFFTTACRGNGVCQNPIYLETCQAVTWISSTLMAVVVLHVDDNQSLFLPLRVVCHLFTLPLNTESSEDTSSALQVYLVMG